MLYFLLRVLIIAVSLWVAVQLVPGITYTGTWLGLLGVALVFGVVNGIIRPILALLTCPLIVITLGLFILVLNALMLLLTSALAGSLGLGFHVNGFLPALLGGIVVGITSALLTLFVGKPYGQREDARQR